MFEASPPTTDGQEPAIEVLVGLALDDLDSGYLDVESALRLVARRAWVGGHREAMNLTDGVTDHHNRNSGRDTGPR